MDIIEDFIVYPTKDFFKASKKLVRNCKKPDFKEFSRLAIASVVGFLVMGVIGYVVRLVSIPLNNILVGGSN